MGSNRRRPAEIQKSFVLRVQSISAHTRGIHDELALMLQGLQDCMESDTGPAKDLLLATSQLSHSTLKSCTNLDSCLSDLVNMGDAMLPVLTASPETAPALLLNFFSTFVTQMGTFYKEMVTCWDQGSQSFGRGKATFFRESPVFGTASAAPTPTASSIGADAPPESDVDRHGTVTVDAPPVKAGRSKKLRLDGVDAGGTGLPPQLPRDSESPTGTTASKKSGARKTTSLIDAGGHTPGKRSEDHLAAAEGSRATAPNAGHAGTPLEEAAESGFQTAVPQRARKKNLLSESPVVDTPAELAVREMGALVQREPQYLLLTSTLEAALGATVMSARPKVFSNMTSFTFEAPLSTYYIRLVRPASLAYLVYCNYIRGHGDMQADFLCDLLEADCVVVDPFASPAGEVVVVDEEDLSSLPACAWGTGSTEDNERRLYTMYALIKQAPHVCPTVIIQDSLNVGSERDEVLHIVTLVDDAPSFARVTCSVSSEVRAAVVPSQKQAAILGFSRSGFAQTGFVEVPYSEVQAAVSHTRGRVDSQAGARMSDFPSENAGAMAMFQPPVQLASLAQPADGTGISLGGVARGAVQGGYEVLKMPLAVGRAVGGALLDATGVTGAMRQNMESVFRKGFPDLGGEPLVDSFNCAWVQRSMPRQGYLFITPRWLCFQSTVSTAHFSVEYDEIKEIVKSKSAKVFENAIEVKTHLNDNFFLSNFVQRDQAYSALMSQWLKQ